MFMNLNSRAYCSLVHM